MGRPKLCRSKRQTERVAFACDSSFKKNVEDAAKTAGLEVSVFVRESLEVHNRWQIIREATLLAAGFLGMSVPDYVLDAIQRANRETDEIRSQIMRRRSS